MYWFVFLATSVFISGLFARILGYCILSKLVNIAMAFIVTFGAIRKQLLGHDVKSRSGQHL